MKYKKNKVPDGRSSDISVVPSTEENPRRETEVDTDEERSALFGPEQDESIDLDFESPLRNPAQSDRPLDITPITAREGFNLGLVDRPDEETGAEYERAAEEDEHRRRGSAS